MPTEESADYLLLLFADAERSLPHMEGLGAEIERAVSGVKCKVAPTKSPARTAVKALEKYNGKYSRVTDLARMTFVCSTLGAVFGVCKRSQLRLTSRSC